MVEVRMGRAWPDPAGRARLSPRHAVKPEEGGVDASVSTRSWVRKAGVLFVLMGAIAALVGIKAPLAQAGSVGGFTWTDPNVSATAGGPSCNGIVPPNDSGNSDKHLDSLDAN